MNIKKMKSLYYIIWYLIFFKFLLQDTMAKVLIHFFVRIKAKKYCLWDLVTFRSSCMIVTALSQLYGVCLVLKRGNYKEMHPNRYIALDYQQVLKVQTETLFYLHIWMLGDNISTILAPQFLYAFKALYPHTRHTVV